MSNWAIEPRRFKLDHLGENWVDCYIDLHDMSTKELEEISKEKDDEKRGGDLIRFMKEKLAGGKLWNGTEVVDMTKEDFDDMPVFVLGELSEFFTQASARKSKQQ